MKKLFLAIYFAALILMIPALFIKYLYSHESTSTTNTIANQAKTNLKVSNDETSFKPGLLFIFKGL